MDFKWLKGMDGTTYEDALRIRQTVFIDEQHVPKEIELDGLDDEVYHLVGYKNGKAAATARIRFIEDNTLKLQRIATLKEFRGEGLGAKILEEIKSFAKEHDIHALVLSSQEHAVPFYEKSYFEVRGESYMEVGIPHRDMIYLIHP